MDFAYPPNSKQIEIQIHSISDQKLSEFMVFYDRFPRALPCQEQRRGMRQWEQEAGRSELDK